MRGLPVHTQNQSLAFLETNFMSPTGRKSWTHLFTTLQQLNQGDAVFGFKNRTPQAGLLWSCEEYCFCPPTPGHCPCLAPSSCPHQLWTSSQGLLAEMRDRADLCIWPWLRPSAMAPSHSPAALPRPMQLWLGRSVSSSYTPAC